MTSSNMISESDLIKVNQFTSASLFIAWITRTLFWRLYLLKSPVSDGFYRESINAVSIYSVGRQLVSFIYLFSSLNGGGCTEFWSYITVISQFNRDYITVCDIRAVDVYLQAGMMETVSAFARIDKTALCCYQEIRSEAACWSLQIINAVFVVGIKVAHRCGDVEALDNPVRGFQRIIIIFFCFLSVWLLFKKPNHMIINITVALVSEVRIKERLNNSVTIQSLSVFHRNPAPKQAPFNLLKTNLKAITLHAFFRLQTKIQVQTSHGNCTVAKAVSSCRKFGLDFTRKRFSFRQYSMLKTSVNMQLYAREKPMLMLLNVKMKALLDRQRKMGALFSVSWLRFIFLCFLLTPHCEQMEEPKWFYFYFQQG